MLDILILLFFENSDLGPSSHLIEKHSFIGLMIV